MVGGRGEKILLFLSFSPCSPSTDKQLTFWHDPFHFNKHRALRRPTFSKAVNLISEGISHLAIIFRTINPTSEELGLSGGLLLPITWNRLS